MTQEAEAHATEGKQNHAAAETRDQFDTIIYEAVGFD